MFPVLILHSTPKDQYVDTNSRYNSAVFSLSLLFGNYGTFKEIT